jgi:hypothetical protein
MRSAQDGHEYERGRERIRRLTVGRVCQTDWEPNGTSSGWLAWFQAHEILFGRIDGNVGKSLW